MAVEIVTGPAFAGKAEFVRGEIERREQAGELGLVLVDYTALYAALVPGEQSALRDASVSDTGAPRAVGSVYDFAAGAILARQLSGYVTTQSPRRAIALADRLGASTIWDVTADAGSLAARVRAHVSALSGRVARAGDGAEGSCGRQVSTYLNERHLLAGRAREVEQVRRGSYRKGGQVQAYDEGAFVRGLTPSGRQARDELVEAGDAHPSPADVFRKTLSNLGRR